MLAPIDDGSEPPTEMTGNEKVWPSRGSFGVVVVVRVDVGSELELLRVLGISSCVSVSLWVLVSSVAATVPGSR
jgi:hypothetical protein